MKNTIFGNKKCLLTTAILFELSIQSMDVNAAVILVDQTNCNLASAITAANTDSIVSKCTAGSGADEIVLSSGAQITLSEALPIINSTITIQGNESSVERDGTDIFRLVDVQAGILTLNDITLSGGASENTGYSTAYGAGIRVSSGTLNTNNVVVKNNSGVGIAIMNNSVATINNSVVEYNTGLPTYFSGGGGLHVAGSQVEVLGSDISNNQNLSVAFGGAGVYISNQDGASTVNINSSSINNNTSNRSGGGINAIVGGNGEDTITLNITNSTISGNTAAENGGGIHCSIISAKITSSTITANTAAGYGSYQGRGGGVSCGISFPPAGSAITIEQSIISGNVAEIGNEVDDLFAVFSGGYNVIGQQGNNGISGPLTPDVSDKVPTVGIENIVEDLTDYSSDDNRGMTHGLVVGSPAIDLINSSINCEGNDQNGVIRPLDGDGSSTNECDAGALEFYFDLIFSDGFE